MMAPSGYQVPRSLRFRGSASAYLSRTFATPTNNLKWTWSAWIKRGALGQQFLLDGGDGSSNNFGYVRFDSSDRLSFYQTTGGVYNLQMQTDSVYRDSSAWYHIVCIYDSANATSTDRVQFWVNSVRQTVTYTTGPFAISTASKINVNTTVHYLRKLDYTTLYGDMYAAEERFIDGQALAPSYFGETSDTGQWIPKKYAGTYGANGFYLPFTDNTLNTLLSNSQNISAPFGGVSTNALVVDGVYCTSNVSQGSSFSFLLNTFAASTQVTRYSITNLSFSGGTSTFAIQSSPDNSTWTTLATLAVTASNQSFSGSLNGNGMYFRLAPVAFGTNGTASVDAFLLYADGLGLDFSGNGNNWTTNNISVTAGVTYDSMLDVPGTAWEDGGNGRGNYCVINSIASAVADTYSQANLKWTKVANNTNTSAVGSIPISSGKWYWEGTVAAAGGSNLTIGIGNINTNFVSLDSNLGITGSTTSYSYNGGSGPYKQNNNTQTSYGATFTTNDVIGVAFDADAGTLTFYKNNTSQGTAFTGITGTFTPACGGRFTNDSWYMNFGQHPFAYTPPTGFKALHTGNLSEPTILLGNRYMDIDTYTGTGATRTKTGLYFQPDLAWFKGRSGATDHALYDSVRGVQKDLASNLLATETTQATGLTAFTSDGYTTGALAKLNTSAATYVNWLFKAGGTATNNTSGSITSSVSAGVAQGISVLTYTGTGTTATVGHGLGVAPKMVITKDRSPSGNEWAVYHANLSSAAYYLALNQTIGQTIAGAWGSTAPTSSVITVGGGSIANQSAYTYVAYCFTDVAGFSAFGSYTGNGSTDGPFVHLGFRPRWVLIKGTAGALDWQIIDTARDSYNLSDRLLYPDLAAVEGGPGGGNGIDIASNGFKLRSANANSNTNGTTFIYAAFAESPFKYSNAR